MAPNFAGPALHEDIFQSPLSTHCFINSFLADIEVLAKPNSGQNQSVVSRPTAWLAPTVEHVKFNTDVAVMRNGSYGVVVAVSRDSVGTFLGVSCITFRNLSDPETLETMGVREASTLVEDLYVKKIHVAPDCKTVVNRVKQGSSAEYEAIIHEII